jgi:hypothetical protein
MILYWKTIKFLRICMKKYSYSTMRSLCFRRAYEARWGFIRRKKDMNTMSRERLTYSSKASKRSLSYYSMNI